MSSKPPRTHPSTRLAPDSRLLRARRRNEQDGAVSKAAGVSESGARRRWLVGSSVFNNRWGSKLKKGKECLGDIIYRYITAEQFSPECLLDCLDLFSEHLTLEVVNRIEAVVHDVGQAILESYSRVLESLAFNIMARIDDLVFVDDAAKQSTSAESKLLFSRGGFGSLPIHKCISPSPFSIQHSPYASPFATPNFCFSPVSGSPARAPPSSTKSKPRGSDDLKLERPNPVEFERIWSRPGNLSAAKARDAPERD